MSRYPAAWAPMRPRLSLVSGVILLALTVAGCGSSPPTSYFVLSTVPPAAVAASGMAGQRSTLAVGSVKLPQVLDRVQIVRRSGANTLDIDGANLWAEPLDELMRRILAEDLAARLPGLTVLSTARPVAPVDRTVIVEVDRFETEVDGHAALAARWYVLGSRDNRPLVSHEVALRAPALGADTASRVAALSQVVADLATDIAARLPAGN
ncbi:MAG TPA: PqiC family protein [Stellaceae bacterium]|nr:PqiC family protein [Stellaceae bacterium]